MRKTRLTPGQWIRSNWLELLLVLVFVAALAWIFQVSRTIWVTATAEPTAAPTARPLIEGKPTSIPTPPPPTAVVRSFDGKRAQAAVATAVALGPRAIGAAAHEVAATTLRDALEQAGWQVEEQTVDVGGVPLRTVIGKAGSGPLVVLGTHYDTPPVADLDPVVENRAAPAPAANDGTSSAAVLVELAAMIDTSTLTNTVWLAFFDGQYPPGGGDPVSVGAITLAESLPAEPLPQAVILLDFAGAADQQFFVDGNSDPALSQTLWSLAQQLGYGQWFLPETRGATDNGALAFRQRGIPVAHIAGVDYPYRRTVDDTADKVDPTSLERVGWLLLAYLQQE